ncbi:MAG: hypothetical protein J6I56_08745 [Lachnospiraceae bacterium]|nr:hypothetical protein [Lachnospiraceae bacterium]
MRKGVNAAQLKALACVTMFIDHFSYALLDVGRKGVYGLIGGGMDETLFYGRLRRVMWTGRLIGRIAFPIFAFLIAEGFLRTKNRAKYLGRLLLFGLISEYPFDHAFYPSRAASYACNVYWTLAAGLAAIWTAELLWEKVILPAVNSRAEGGAAMTESARVCITALCGFAFGFLALKVNTDYDIYGVLVIVAFYLTRQYLDLGGVLSLSILCMQNPIEICGLPGILAIRSYNGERGRQMKWFFYIFYPAHLMALYLIRKAMIGY